MLNSIKLVFLCFYVLLPSLFRAFEKLGQKSVNNFVGFLVCEKTRKKIFLYLEILIIFKAGFNKWHVIFPGLGI